MPLPVVEDHVLARFVWESSLAPRRASFGLHFEDEADTGDINALWTAINANVTAGMWDVMGGTAVVKEVDLWWLNGFSAGVVKVPVAAAKWQSGSAGEIIPQGAAVVSFHTALRGPAFRNRAYLPFVAEASQANGTLTPAAVATMQAAWDTFRAAMDTAGWRMAVVSPSTNQGNPASDSVVRPYLKTQRRRSRR